MNIAAAGNLMLFFSVLVGLILVGLVVFSYAAYSFLLTLTNSAAGNDEIIWPGDPISDWFFKVWYLGWLLAVWAVPASLVAAVLNLPAWQSALCVGGVLWLIFPVALLSSLSAESRLIVFRPAIVGMMLRHFGATLCFYASSALVVFICGAFVWAAVVGLRSSALNQPLVLIPLGAAMAALGWLIYARLLGRTALLISQSSPGQRRKSSDEQHEERQASDPWSLPAEEVETKSPRRPRPSSKAPPKTDKVRSRKQERAFDPWAVPAEEAIPKKTKPNSSAAPIFEDPYGPAEGTYELMAEGAGSAPPELPPRPAGRGEEKAESYTVSATSHPGPTRLPPPVPPEIAKREEELAAPRGLPPLPDWPLLSGVYSFPFYPTTLGPCGTLALGFFGVLALVRVLLFFFPS